MTRSRTRIAIALIVAVLLVAIMTSIFTPGRLDDSAPTVGSDVDGGDSEAAAIREVADVPNPETDAGEEPLEDARYFGRVVDAVSGDPLADARVVMLAWFSWIDIREVAEATTDRNGRFRFPGVSPGVSWIDLIVSCPGYIPYDGRRSFPGNHSLRTRRFDTVELSRGVAVRGIVVSAEGTPVAGATVCSGAVPHGESGADGVFEIRVPEGRQGVRAVDPGRCSDDVRIEAIAGESVSGVRLQLYDSLRIEGRVVDEADRPVAGAVVDSASVVLGFARTDENGEFVLDHVTDDPEEVMVITDSHLQWRGEVAISESPVTLRLEPGAVYTFRLRDEAGAPVVPIDCWLRGKEVWSWCPLRGDSYRTMCLADPIDRGTLHVPGHAIKVVELPADPGTHDLGVITVSKKNRLDVTVVGPDDRPVAAAKLEFRSRDYGSLMADGRDSVATDSGGRALLSGLPLGDGEVRVGAPGYPIQRHEVTFVEDRQVFRLQLRPGAKIRGRVVDSAGDIIAGASVRGPNEVTRETAYTDETGSFELGTFELGVAVRLRFAAAGFRWSSLVLRLEEEVVDLPDVVLSRGSTIRGIVVDMRGNPVPGVDIELDSSPSSTVSDTRGEFVIRHQDAGRYEIEAEKDGYTALPVGVDVAEESDAFVTVRVEKGYPYSGRVRSLSGRAIDGARVSVVSRSPYDRSSTSTDADGEFHFVGVPAKPVELDVEHVEWRTHTYRASHPRELPTEFRIPAGADLRVAVGDVTLPDDMEAAEVWIGVKRVAVAESMRWNYFEYPRDELVIRGLASGDAEVGISFPGFVDPEPMAVTLHDEQEATLPVSLEPLPPMSEVVVRVVGRNGAPIPGALIAASRKRSRTSRTSSSYIADERGEARVALGAGRSMEIEVSAPTFGEVHIEEPHERARNGVLEIALEKGASFDLSLTWSHLEPGLYPEVTLIEQGSTTREWVDFKEQLPESWTGRWRDTQPGLYDLVVSIDDQEVLSRTITLHAGQHHEESAALPDPIVVSIVIDAPAFLFDPGTWYSSELGVRRIGAGSSDYTVGSRVREGLMETRVYTPGEYELTFSNAAALIEQRFRRSITSAGRLRLQIATSPIEGRVVDDQGRPLAGVQGTLGLLHGTGLARFTTDEEGRFRLGHAEPGPYEWAIDSGSPGFFDVGLVSIDSANEVELELRRVGPVTLRLEGELPSDGNWHASLPGLGARLLHVGSTATRELELQLPLGELTLILGRASLMARVTIENKAENQVVPFTLTRTARIGVSLDDAEIDDPTPAVLRVIHLGDAEAETVSSTFPSNGELMTTWPLALGNYSVEVELRDGRRLSKTIRVTEARIYRVEFP